MTADPFAGSGEPLRPAAPVVPVLGGTVGAAGSAAPASVRVALYDIDPDTVVGLVASCPAVAGLSSGPFGAAATYLPGRTVLGVRITPTVVEVHVVARYGVPVAVLAGQVRRVLSGQVLDRTVDIVVEDLEDPPGYSRAAPTLPASLR